MNVNQQPTAMAEIMLGIEQLFSAWQIAMQSSIGVDVYK